MKKQICLVIALVLSTAFVYAQSVDDGIKFLYYGRNKSAMDVLQKVVASKPKDAYSIYWLGQAMLAQDDIQGAKTLYQNALNSGVNEPWIWIGMGHVQLRDSGDINSAKQKFEQAITSAKGKKGDNPDILNAIGRANADGNSKQGDPVYGVDVLKRAKQINPKNPDIDINLGTCYLKMGSDRGGDAVQAFTDAITIDPKYAAAYTLIGTVYKSQDNKPSMTEWYDKAIAADPTYGPVYLAYFIYYEERDVNKAKQYLDLWTKNSDQDCETRYFTADYLFRAGKYQESLDSAKAMAAGECRNFPRINILFAYNYDRLGDSMQAKNYLDKFFSNISTIKIEPEELSRDYILAGNVYAKTGMADTASSYFQKAIQLDTVKAHKLDYVTTASNLMAKTNNFSLQQYWMNQLVALKGGKLAESDYYNLDKAAIDAKNYTAADSIAQQYITAYPDKPQGYGFRATALKALDADTTKGLAIDAINKYNDFLMKDTAVKDTSINKKLLFNNYYYLLAYYAQYAANKDIPQAIAITDKMMALYTPGSDEYNFANNTKAQLQKALDQSKKKSSPPSKSASEKKKPGSGKSK
ncbi:MAG: tetratricopeptide repeat protein [Chitinophagaceae bacterium]